MGKIVRCSIVIYDDFNNVLIAERGKKADRAWGLFGKEMKGKEVEERCISKAVEKDIKCTVFDLKPINEYVINEENEEMLKVFSGSIKEYITCHKTINSVKWINKRELDKYNFNEEDKKILEYFFSNR